MPEFSVLGQRLPGIDVKEKVLGQAEYGADMKRPGMLYGKILRSPHPHARVLKVDASRAKSLRGVKVVLVPDDVPKVKWGKMIADQYVLTVDKARYAGDEVAAVAAIDEDTAQEALELITVEYEPLPAVFDPEEAMKPGAPLVHEAQQNIANSWKFHQGDVDRGFSEAAVILEDDYYSPLVHQGYMEPMVCIAEFDASGKLTLWMPMQSPSVIRHLYGKLLGISPSNIRVFQTIMGGGFGSKIEHNLHPITTLLAQKAGRPVKITLTRAEEHIATYPRVPMKIHLKMGLRKDGTIAAKESRIVADNGAYTMHAPAITVTAATRPDSLYRIKNVRVQAYLVYTNKTISGPFRGFGNAQMTFALESMMDALAEKLGMDPVEVRLRNATQTGDVTAYGWNIGSSGLSDCIRNVAEKGQWQQKRSSKTADRGVGVASCIHVCGNRSVYPDYYEGSSAIVRVNEEGKATVISGEVDLGQGCRTVFAQITAEEIGLPFEDVVAAKSVDTEVAPFGLGTYADRVTTIGGNAVKAAAADAKRQIIEVAADLLEASKEDLRINNGKVYVEGSPDKSVTVAEVAKKSLFRNAGTPIIGKGNYQPNTQPADRNTGYGNISPAYAFASHLVEVEVDRETGNVKVVNFVAAHDLGRSINPMLAEGQVHGAVVQGLGYALSEELLLKDGKVQNLNLSDYRLPRITETPEITPILVESIDPAGPFGAKGLGEPALVPVAPAVANAIYNAVGVRITELPITQEKVLAALKQQNK